MKAPDHPRLTMLLLAAAIVAIVKLRQPAALANSKRGS
jgi:hypothetical protein